MKRKLEVPLCREFARFPIPRRFSPFTELIDFLRFDSLSPVLKTGSFEQKYQNYTQLWMSPQHAATEYPLDERAPSTSQSRLRVRHRHRLKYTAARAKRTSAHSPCTPLFSERSSTNSESLADKRDGEFSKTLCLETDKNPVKEESSPGDPIRDCASENRSSNWHP